MHASSLSSVIFQREAPNFWGGFVESVGLGGKVCNDTQPGGANRPRNETAASDLSSATM